MVKMLAFALLVFSATVVADETILKPSSTTGSPLAVVLVGRNDTTLPAYVPLGQELQTAMAPDMSVWVVLRTDLQGVEDTLAKLKTDHKVENVVFTGHSMSGGGVAVQDYVAKNPTSAKGVILLAGFLQRTHRPDVVDCIAKWAVQPKASLQHPLGFLEDGAHDCIGPNTPEYPVPVLTVGGELDGVVRITRVAEAYYTQAVLKDQSKNMPVVVLEGFNHAVLLTGDVPPAVASMDLKAEVTAAAALTTVGTTVQAFVKQLLEGEDQKQLVEMQSQAADFFEPIVEAFVNQEGNWFFTGGDDEHGSSAWAAQAQQIMGEPTPVPFKWNMKNEFHMLTDEEGIPPYYRHKHRPSVVPTNPTNTSVDTSTVTQLRFIELTVLDTDAGLNGYEIIKEEKVNILSAVPDDGSQYLSAIELASKLASRQHVYNVTGNFPAPDSLDDGSRCKPINEAAYKWAGANAGSATTARFSKYGLPMTFADDIKPTIPAGPFWIWAYAQYNKTATSLAVQSYYAFFSEFGDPYGAGNHYCKLLSPARAMEWMYVDGLRDKYHL